jgi:2-keto-3-deoxy-L-rhamnonate aldolase RhmA
VTAAEPTRPVPSFRAAIADRPPLLGTFVKIPAPETCEIIARSGFDFVIIDTEHALISVRDVYTMVTLFCALGVMPLVRVTDHGYGDGQRYLDAGAAGVLVPHVSDAAQAQQVARQYLFPPDGTRGMGFAARAGLWGSLEGGAAEYVRFGQQDAARIAMIEETGAVANIDAIMATPGIDAVFIGPGDLSLSMGVAMNDPQVVSAVDGAIEAAVAAGVPVGTVVPGPDEARRRAAQGCSFLLVGNDTGMFLGAATRAVTSVREVLG